MGLSLGDRAVRQLAHGAGEAWGRAWNGCPLVAGGIIEVLCMIQDLEKFRSYPLSEGSVFSIKYWWRTEIRSLAAIC